MKPRGLGFGAVSGSLLYICRVYYLCPVEAGATHCADDAPLLPLLTDDAPLLPRCASTLAKEADR